MKNLITCLVVCVMSGATFADTWTVDEREGHLSSLPREGSLICEPLLTPGCVLTTKASWSTAEFRVYEPDMNNDPCWLRGTISLGFLPAGIEIGPNGNIFVWEQVQGQLHEYSGVTGEYVQAFISGDTGINGRGFCFMQNGDVLVSCGSDSKIARFDGTTGEYIGDFVAAGSGGLSVCFGVDIGPNNNVFACSQKTNQIIQYDGITGDFIGIYASVTSPYDLTFAPDGTLFVTTRYDGNIYKFASDGSPLGQFNDINISPARGIDIGTDGDVYVACWDDHAGFMAGAYRFDGITGELKESLPQPNAIFCCVNGEPTLGACCTNNQASCVMSTQTDCEYFGGNFQGYSVECIDVSCQTSCLGDVTGDGQVDVSDILVIIAVWGSCP